MASKNKPDGSARAISVRAAPWALGAVTAILAVALAALGILNRQSVERASAQAYDGRALEIGLGTAGALLVIRPGSREALAEAIGGLVGGPVSSMAVINRRGLVLGSSDPAEAGSNVGGSRAFERLQRGGVLHQVERLRGGDMPRYRVWILLRPGIRRDRRGWRRGDWRRGLDGDPGPGKPGEMPSGEKSGGNSGEAPPLIGPWGGEGHELGGGMRRGMGRGSGRGEGNGFGRSEGRGPGQGGASGLGRGTWRRGEGGEALALGRAILRLEVEVDDPPIAAAVSRSREVQVVTLSASGVLLLLGLLAFLGQRRAVRMRRRLGEQRRLAEMGELAAVLAHEIRNPLGVIKGYSQLLRERSNGEDAATLDRLVGETGRLERLVNGLLDFARPTPPKIQEVDLVELCTRACELASDEAQRREVRFVLDLEPVRLAADPDMLLQALLNLIRNAVQASRAGEAVTVRCLRQGSSASITVLDAGPGLPEGLGEDIFKPFVTTRAGGTGLGLAVSRRIAEEHGGELTASPGEERGAMFRLRLPIGRASQEGA